MENTLYLEGKNSIDKIKIYNLNGKLILENQPEISNPKLAIENLSSGVYLMKVEIEGNQKVVQLIKK